MQDAARKDNESTAESAAEPVGVWQRRPYGRVICGCGGLDIARNGLLPCDVTRRPTEEPPTASGVDWMRVGILDILALPARNTVDHLYHRFMTKQFASITPQAISVWCRRMGHRTLYATYYGVG